MYRTQHYGIVVARCGTGRALSDAALCCAKKNCENVRTVSLATTNWLDCFHQKVLEPKDSGYMFRVPSVHGPLKNIRGELKRRRRELGSFCDFSPKISQKSSGKSIDG
jgi:hypothetical protein